MKRYLVLTSVLALAACGGGSGGSHGEISDGMTNEQRAAVESNKNITGMLTYLETDGNHNTLISRTATTRNAAVAKSDGVSGGKFDLSNVEFIAIDEDFDDDIGFKFVVDENKKIIGIDMGLKSETGYPNRDSDEPDFIRKDDSNVFAGLVNADDDKDDEDNKNELENPEINQDQNQTFSQNENNQPTEEEENGGNWVPAELTYNSYGKKIGLKYSDFGNLAVKNLSADEDQQRIVFIGGYDDAKRIQESDINKDTTFTGIASGSVVAILDGDGSGKFLNLDTSANKSNDRKVATLNFDGKTATLKANFDNWYDVTYVNGADGKSITFDNYVDTTTDINGETVNAGTFRMLSDKGNKDSFTVENTQYKVYEEGKDTGKTVDSINSEIRYFGDNNTPSEAVGLIQIRDREDGAVGLGYGDKNNPNKEVRVNIGFGGKAQ